MRIALSLGVAVLLAGCQVDAPRGDAAHGDALARLDAALPGDYDNDEQVRTVRAQVPVPHLRENLRALDRERGFWAWRLQTANQPAETWWLYRFATSADGRITATPYRPLDPAKVSAELADPKFSFKFVPERWAELAPCALRGEWKSTQLHIAADVAACSALLPGLGEAAALLPLRLTLDGEMLRTATFADQARGTDASIDARRLRWFSGWSAINGGGPSARAGNQDWHTHDDLRLSSEGGRVPIRWRDGTPSGWSLELRRATYAERKLSVLQLDVIEDAGGRTIDYAWTSPNAQSIGINLGWLQVGIAEQPRSQ